MRTLLRDLVRVALGAMLSIGLLASSASTIGMAQTSNSVSTLNIAHEVTFQYPGSWSLVLDSARFPGNARAAKYADTEAIAVESPDIAPNALAAFLFVFSSSSSPLQSLQSLIAMDASDTTGFPSFNVVTPPAPAQVANADRSAATDYVFKGSDGSVSHYFQLEAVTGAAHYRLELLVTPDAQVPQYQTEISQIQNSFQLLP